MKFRKFQDVLDHNETTENPIDYEDYTDSIKKYDLYCYENINSILIKLINETIDNYNNYGSNIKIAKILSNTDEISNYNADPNPEKTMEKDDEFIGNFYQKILLCIIQQFTNINLIEGNKSKINETYTNHEQKIKKEFKNIFLIHLMMKMNLMN